MAGALSLPLDLAWTLVLFAGVAAIALHGLALVRFLRRRRAGDAPVQSALLPALQNDAHQSRRLFSLLDAAAVSAGRAIEAHKTASQHLDSAEYQLERLFDELPMLAAFRTSNTAPPVSVLLIVPQPAQALAA